ncbi:hypothetical protein SHKM778_41720 [Streptomyces sp. KM77-8]|uniref:Amidohydrolase-related domain-containing protein n=1 Tax=Streptomyces haneummycinicus TaxID=3074435 RepID=A0AAT9HKF6_9ACTN
MVHVPPGADPYDRFLAKCRELDRLGVRFSVGVVGLPDHLDAARRLRAVLPERVYLWVNAAEGHRYDDTEAGVWTALDPLFPYSRRPTTARACPAARGVRHLRRRRGHRPPLPLRPRRTRQPLRRQLPAGPAPPPVPLTTCDCHIGYVHLETLPLYDVFAGGVLERIPAPGGRPSRAGGDV